MSELLVQLLISVAVVGGVTLVLAGMLILADATIANYGEVRIVVNDDKELTVRGGLPLLAALKEEGIFIPSACGGRGSCGLCRVRVAEGAGGILPTELPWLTPEERTSGVRLSCQVKVKRPMRLHVPEELLSIRQFETRVEAIRDLTYDIKEVTLALAGGERLDFRAGQFVQFEVPAYEFSTEPVYRAYSVASDPAEARKIELEIRLVPNGICTTYVHRHLRERERILINGPYGDFYLREGERDLVFIAGGSGMAPIRAMLFDMARRGDARKMTYFFGARTTNDLFLMDEMREFERRLPAFKFVPALSAPEANEPWEGETGLITDVVDRHVTSGDNVDAYLCGSPGMIDASIKVLRAKGVPENRIFFDKFA